MAEKTAPKMCIPKAVLGIALMLGTAHHSIHSRSAGSCRAQKCWKTHQKKGFQQFLHLFHSCVPSQQHRQSGEVQACLQLSQICQGISVFLWNSPPDPNKKAALLGVRRCHQPLWKWSTVSPVGPLIHQLLRRKRKIPGSSSHWRLPKPTWKR